MDTTSAEFISFEDEIKLNPEHLLYSALSLLGFDFQEQSKLLNVKIGPGAFEEDNPKAFYSILKFLICKLLNGGTAETVDLLLFYPPRNLKDIINFKQEAFKILSQLQQRHILPESLFISKIVLDEVGGRRCIQFLRFLSEFTLKAEFLSAFPQNRFAVFNLNPRNEKKTDHQLHSIDELYPSITVLSPEKEAQHSLQEISYQIEVVKSHLDMEFSSIQKKMKKYNNNTTQISVLAENLNKQYQNQRNFNIQLRKYLAESHDIPQKLLTDLRKLDRMPQIDLIKQTLLELSQIKQQLTKSEFQERYQNFLKEFLVSDAANVISSQVIQAESQNQDNNGIIKVENYFESFRSSLKVEDRNIQNMKTEQFISFQQPLLDKLRKLKSNSGTLTASLNSLKGYFEEYL